MPSTTLAGWENRIRQYSPTLERTTIRKLAKTINRRFEHYNDCDLARIIQYSDPTGEEATKRADRERNQAAAERRHAA
ncbi:hypothetical protein ArV2_gp37 [Arthrobacter phage vB_ArS-ArV2]|uniref:Uncharacterized protein n=1 Tax=Arthrobacter phage vB_ArS-ArV2 TaxID=1414742 RepID=V5R910_9CAUD|nr:hypothetical protein ArV2_gp37 [Arthrobacter phage vB_ArS-ArV2]AHB31648.1 hypothetical protein ArV2_gp37 [Arthrobacter phage vB_ArS-ArV2]